MSRYLLAPAAQVDLEQIWDYTHHRWGVDQAELPTVHTRCSIGSAPKASIDVVRVLHQRMDVDRHL